MSLFDYYPGYPLWTQEEGVIALAPSLAECTTPPSEEDGDSALMEVDPIEPPVHGDDCQCAEHYQRKLHATHLKELDLGKGTYGSVYLYQSRESPCTRHAVKVIEGGFWGGKQDRHSFDVRREVELQQRASLQGIAPNVDQVIRLGSAADVKRNCFAVWMRPVGHANLWHTLDNTRTCTARGVHRLMREMVRLLEGLQKAGVAHLDLAPANIRVQRKPNLITDVYSLEDIEALWAVDFGLSLPVQLDEMSKVHYMEDAIVGGQYDVMPPERLVQYARDRPGPWYARLLEMAYTRQLPAPAKGHHGLEMTDIYSAGVILWWALTGESALRPIEDRIYKKFLNAKCQFFETMDQPEYLGCRALIQRMEFENPNHPRPALRMPQLADLVYGMTAWDMSQRWTLERIKAHPFVANEFDQLGEEWIKVIPGKAVAER